MDCVIKVNNARVAVQTKDFNGSCSLFLLLRGIGPSRKVSQYVDLCF